MKYRIKKITYKDNSVKYTAEYNNFWWFWRLIAENGLEESSIWDYSHYLLDSREDALKAINEHYKKNIKYIEQSIEIEYINK